MIGPGNDMPESEKPDAAAPSETEDAAKAAGPTEAGPEPQSVVPAEPEPAEATDAAAPDAAPTSETVTELAAKPEAPLPAGSLKLDFAVGASALALALSCLMVILQPSRPARSAPGILIYNAELTAKQAEPFMQAGFDGPAVIQQAFDAAVAAGNILLLASDEIAAPPSSIFQIEDFVALPDRRNR